MDEPGPGRRFTAAEQRGFAAAGELLALGLDLLGGGVPTSNELRLVLAIFARATSVLDGVIWLCRGTMFGQAEILNRVLFEDMASAHWVVVDPTTALLRIEQHEKLEDILWRDVAEKYPQLFGDVGESMYAGERADLIAVFGTHGHKHWTGLGMHALLKEIENEWTEGKSRDELWMFWRIAQRRNSSQVHGGAGSYADAAMHTFGMRLSQNPGFVGAGEAGGPLASAIWIYGQLIGLILDKIDDSRRPDFDAVWARVNVASQSLAAEAASRRRAQG